MYMFKYVSKRLGLMLLTFSIIFTMCFVLIKLLPIPTTALPGQDPEIVMKTLEGRGWITNIKEGSNGVWTYDRVPIMLQFGTYIKRIVTDLDFGIATTYGEYLNMNLWKVFVNHLPPTILINIYSTLIGVPIGLALGIIAALKKNKWQDHVISTAVMVFVSVPSYVYAFLVQYFMCFKWQLFPFQMKAGYDYLSWETFVSLVPAILSLGFGTIAGLTRYVRAELTEVLTSDYLLLARTKGLSRAQTTVRHALRNAMVPVFPMILGEFIGIMSGSLIIEGIFGIPGVGPLYVGAVGTTPADYYFFMLLTAFYTIIGLASGIVVDLSYGFIDPRIRMGSKK